jgi:hypothetical protein
MELSDFEKKKPRREWRGFLTERAALLTCIAMEVLLRALPSVTARA